MPVVVHKVLIHGTQIIRNSKADLLSVGLLSDKAQEARNRPLCDDRIDEGIQDLLRSNKIKGIWTS